MFTLPENKPQKPKKAPHNFFIWGATMSGKSYFASYFPHPLVLNTDGNSAMGTAPSIQIRNIRNTDGTLKQSAIEQVNNILLALQTQNDKYGYETVVIDVIDDLCTMFEQAICLQNNVMALSDIPYGKGYALFNTVLQQFVMDLKALPLNVIYISRELSITDESTGKTSDAPSLKSKYYNIVNGNCDLVIHTKRVAGYYTKTATDHRTDYSEEDIENPRILQLLQKVNGVFTKTNKTNKNNKGDK